MLGRQLYDTFRVFLLTILWRGLEGGKQVSTSFRKFAPTLVLQLADQGGLKKILFICLLLLFTVSCALSNDQNNYKESKSGLRPPGGGQADAHTSSQVQLPRRDSKAILTAC